MASSHAAEKGLTGFFNTSAGKFIKGALKLAFFGVAFSFGMDFIIGGFTHAPDELAKGVFGAFQEFSVPFWEWAGEKLPGTTVTEQISPLTNFLKGIHEWLGVYDTFQPEVLESTKSVTAEIAAEKLVEENGVIEGFDFISPP